MTGGDPVPPALLLRGVARSFPGPNGGPPVEVLRGVDLEVRSGEAVALTGPSGSGKTTLLRIAGLLDRPDRGEVHLAGEDALRLSERERDRRRAERLGFVFQTSRLLPPLTALENVLVPNLALRRRPPKRERLARGEALLDRVGLGHRRDHRPGELSTGECQRVAVARALANGPSILLADEPTGSLDAAASEALVDLLLDLRARDGLTLLVVTHSAAVAARMDRALALDLGRADPMGAP